MAQREASFYSRPDVRSPKVRAVGRRRQGHQRSLRGWLVSGHP